MRWTSIEVFDGPFAARQWAETYADALIETAVTSGALDWELKRTAWGIVFEVAFRSDAEWNAYKDTPVVVEALKTAPNPSTGVLIYRGRSLDGGHGAARKPKPKTGSGSSALALPLSSLPLLEPLPPLFSDTRVDRRLLTRR